MRHSAPPILRVSAFLFISTFVLSVPLSAQSVGGAWETLYRFDGAYQWDGLGYSVSHAGDVNGDGFDDIIVGAPFANPSGMGDAGSAYVFSGMDGSLLRQFDGPASGDWMGYSVSGAGDVNSDGFADLIIGAPWTDVNGDYDAGSAYVYSGYDGSLLRRFDGTSKWFLLGDSVSGAGDVNNDGFDDVIVGAPEADPHLIQAAGSAFVYSGADGSLLWRFNGTDSGSYLGDSVSGAGDMNGDGFDDVIVGVPYADPGGTTNGGSVYVLSGADGSPLHQFHGTGDYDRLGISVSDAGDVNGDGTVDLIAGAPYANPNIVYDSGSAFVYSGADGSLLWQFNGTDVEDYLGYSVSGAGDVNGDGLDDIIIGAPWADPGGNNYAGSAFVHSGADGTLLHEYNGAAYDYLGTSVSGGGDVNGDGLADLIAGANGAAPNGNDDAGSAFVFGYDTFFTASATSISSAAGGTVVYAMNFPGSEGNRQYAMLGSAAGTGPTTMQGVDIPLTQDWLFQKMASGNAPGAFSNPYGVLDGSGGGSCTLTIPPGAASSFIGRTLWFATVSYTPPLRLSSAAMPLTIDP